MTNPKCCRDATVTVGQFVAICRVGREASHQRVEDRQPMLDSIQRLIELAELLADVRQVAVGSPAFDFEFWIVALLVQELLIERNRRFEQAAAQRVKVGLLEQRVVGYLGQEIVDRAPGQPEVFVRALLFGQRARVSAASF